MNAAEGMRLLEDAAVDDAGVRAALIFFLHRRPEAEKLMAILHPNMGDETPCPTTRPDGKGPGNP